MKKIVGKIFMCVFALCLSVAVFCGCGERYEGCKLVFECDNPLLVLNDSKNCSTTASVELVGGSDIDETVSIDISDSKVAKISNITRSERTTTFTITALGAGKATCIARLVENSEISAKFDFEVDVKPTSIVADNQAPYILENSQPIEIKDLLLCKVLPNDVTNKKINYYFGENVAPVSKISVSKGKVFINEETEGVNLSDNKITLKAVAEGSDEKSVITDVTVRVVRSILTSVSYYNGIECNEVQKIAGSALSPSFIKLNSDENNVYAKVEVISAETNISSVSFEDEKSFAIISLFSRASESGKTTFIYKIASKYVLSDVVTLKVKSVFVDNKFEIEQKLEDGESLSLKIVSKPEKITVNSMYMVEYTDDESIKSNPNVPVFEIYHNSATSYKGEIFSFRTLPLNTDSSYLGATLIFDNNLVISDLSGNKLEPTDQSGNLNNVSIKSNDKILIKAKDTTAIGNMYVVHIKNANIKDDNDACFLLKVVKGLERGNADLVWELENGKETEKLFVITEDSDVVLGDIRLDYNSDGLRVWQDEVNKALLHFSATKSLTNRVVNVTVGGGCTFTVKCNVVCTPTNITLDVANNSSILRMSKTKTTINIDATLITFDNPLKFIMGYSELNADVSLELQNGNGGVFVVNDDFLYSTKLGKDTITAIIKYKKLEINTVTGSEETQEYSVVEETREYKITINVVELSTSVTLTDETVTIYNPQTVGFLCKDQSSASVVLGAISEDSIGTELLSTDNSGDWWENKKLTSNDEYHGINYFECVIQDGASDMFDVKLKKGFITFNAKYNNFKEGSFNVSFVLHQFGRVLSKTVKVYVKSKTLSDKISISTIDSSLIYNYSDYMKSIESASGLRLDVTNGFIANFSVIVSPDTASNKDVVWSVVGGDSSQWKWRIDSSTLDTLDQDVTEPVWESINIINMVPVGAGGEIKFNITPDITNSLPEDLWLVICPKDRYNENGINKGYSIYVKLSPQDGSKASPFKIENASEFITYLTSENGLSKYYQICNTIDLSNYTSYLPFGTLTGGITGASYKLDTSKNYFENITDGNKQLIRGINLTANNLQTKDKDKNTLENARMGLFSEIANKAVLCNLQFEGSINATNLNVSSYIGMVAGVNRGKIAYCDINALQSNVSFAKSTTNNGHIGLVVGLNETDTEKPTESGLILGCRVRQKNSIGEFKISGDCYFGGVAGLNKGTIEGFALKDNYTKLTLDNLITNFNKSNFVAILNISATNVLGGGMVTGENFGNVNLCHADGNITAYTDNKFNESESFFGGLVAINYFKLTNSITLVYISASATKENNFKYYVGGIVGKQTGVENEKNVIEEDKIVLDNNFLLSINDRENDALSTRKINVSISNSFGVLAGYMDHGGFKDSYYLNYVKNTNSTSPFGENNKTDATEYNKKRYVVGSLKVDNLNNESCFYYLDIQNNPFVFQYGIKQGETSREEFIIETSLNISSTLSSIKEISVEGSYKFDSQKAELIAIASTKDLKEYQFNVVFSNSDVYNIDSKNASVASVNSDHEFSVQNTGVAEFNCWSYFDKTKSAYCYLQVFEDVESLEFNIGVNGGEVNIDNKTVTLYKNEPFAISVNKPLHLLGDFEIVARDDNKEIIEELLLANFDDSILLTYNEKTTTAITVNFYRVVKCKVALYAGANLSKLFGAQPYATMTLNCINGTREVKTDIDEIEVASGGKVNLSLSILTDVANNAVIFRGIDNISLSVNCDAKFKFHSKFVSFNAPEYTKDGSNLHELKIYNENGKTLLAQVKIIVLKPEIESIVATYYSTEADYKNQSGDNSSSQIYSGSWNGFGVLKLDVMPVEAMPCTLRIYNTDINAVKLKFMLYSNSTGATIIEEGDDYIVVELPNEQKELLLQVILPNETYLPNNTLLQIGVNNEELLYPFVFSFYSKNIDSISVGLAERENASDSDTIYVAYNCLYTLTYNQLGFDFDTTLVSISGDKKVVIGDVTKDNVVFEINGSASFMLDGTTIQLKPGNDVGGTFKIKATAYKEGRKKDFAKESERTFEIEYYVLTALLFEGGVLEDWGTADTSDDVIFINTEINEMVDLSVLLINGVNIEYDESLAVVASKVRSANGKIFDRLKLCDYTVFSDYFIETLSNNTKTFTPTKVYNGYTDDYQNDGKQMTFEINFAYNNGEIGNIASAKDPIILSTKFKIVSFQRTEENEYLVVSTYDDLMHMVEGNNYRLTNDIVLPSSFTPITTRVNKFDGNGYKFYLSDSITIDSATWSIFDISFEGFFLCNLTVELGRALTFMVNSNECAISVLCSTNAGIIFNCRVVGKIPSNSITVSRNATSAGDVSFAFISNINDGTIISCQVENINSFKSNGSIYGLVNENNAIISNSYVKNCSFESTEDKSTTIVAGFVNTNNSTGIITGCYVEVGSLNKLVSKVNISGFVYTNNGKINDCSSSGFIDAQGNVAGFVYLNKGTTAIITNCLSCPNFSNNDDGSKMPFIAGISNKYHNEDGAEIVSSFYKFGSTNLTPLEGINEVTSNTNGKTFSSCMWDMSSEIPKLIGANIIISSHYIVAGFDVDSQTNKKIVKWDLISGYNVGSKNNPYLINSAKNFELTLNECAVSNKVNCYMYIVKNINYEDLDGICKTSNFIFNGVLEGNGCSISGVSLSSNLKQNSSGLFSEIGQSISTAVVKNLTVNAEIVNFTNSNTVGILAGKCTNAYLCNINVYSPKMVKGGTSVGGVVGTAINSKLTNITSMASVNATTSSQSANIDYAKYSAIDLTREEINYLYMASASGVLVGRMQSGSSIEIGRVAGEQLQALGQIVGSIVGVVEGTAQKYTYIKDCRVFASINIKSLFASGGLVGYLNCSYVATDTGVDTFNIINCNFVENTCTFNAEESGIYPVFVGGVVAIMKNGRIDLGGKNVNVSAYQENAKYAGGVAGFMQKGVIKNLVVNENVQAHVYAGGIVARIEAKGVICIENCVVSGNVISSGLASESGGICAELINETNNQLVTISNNTVISAGIRAYFQVAGIVARLQIGSENVTLTGNTDVYNYAKITNNKIGLTLENGKIINKDVNLYTYGNGSTLAGKVVAESTEHWIQTSKEEWNEFGAYVRFSNIKEICNDLTTVKINTTINTSEMVSKLNEFTYKIGDNEPVDIKSTFDVMYDPEDESKMITISSTNYKIDGIKINGKNAIKCLQSDGTCIIAITFDKDVYAVDLVVSDKNS